MPYNDREKQKAFQRQWVKDQRANERRKMQNDDGKFWWTSRTEGEHIQGTIVDIKRGTDTPARYFIKLADGQVLALEETSRLNQLLQVSAVVHGDWVDIEYTGKRRSKRNGRDYKTYRLVVQKQHLLPNRTEVPPLLKDPVFDDPLPEEGGAGGK